MLEKLRGEATAILASSGTIQYSFEQEGRYSLFTRHMLEGMETGHADKDEDGIITVDDITSAKRKLAVGGVTPMQTE